MRRLSADLFWKESSLCVAEGCDFSDFSLLQSSALADAVAKGPAKIIERTRENSRPGNDRSI
jgi:hypothetical protein